MLLELFVENYAVVEKLRLPFHPGFNVLTGETGSGKSIVVDAFGLLLGGRTSSDMVRSGATRARVAGIFEVPQAMRPVLEQAGIEIEDNEVLIEREIAAGGKSRAFVGSRLVTASLLRDLAPHLGDIHGQHEQQRLFSSEAQLDILDAFAGTSPLVAEAGAVYREWRQCADELEEIERAEQEKLRMLDMWSFQYGEIKQAGLKPEEDVALENERKVLMNVGKLMDAGTTAYAALYDDPGSVHAQLRTATKKIEELTRIDRSLESLLQTLQPAQVAIEEASDVLRDYLGKVEADPERLDEIESRLSAISKLKRKYGATVEEVIAFGENVHREIQQAETAGERRAEVQKRQEALRSKYEGLAGELTAKRRTAGEALARRVEAELRSLALGRSEFRVAVDPGRWSESGADTIRFLISANVGEEPRLLERVASGGELSRIALALKTCVSAAGKGRTLVFDEVDAGIGGAAADSVGKRLKSLAKSSQVLCVTHLAQIAGYADHHYAVEKHEEKGRTVTSVEELAGTKRTHEIGRMLSGQVTPEALRHAEQLIRSGGK